MDQAKQPQTPSTKEYQKFLYPNQKTLSSLSNVELAELMYKIIRDNKPWEAVYEITSILDEIR